MTKFTERLNYQIINREMTQLQPKIKWKFYELGYLRVILSSQEGPQGLDLGRRMGRLEGILGLRSYFLRHPKRECANKDCCC